MVSRSPRIVLWRKMQVGGRRSKAWGVGEENWPKGFRGIWVEESVVMSSTYLNLLLRKYPFYIPVGASSQDQSFLTLTLLTFGAGGFFVIRGFPVPCRTFNSIPSCDSLLMPQNISRLYQLSTEGKIPPIITHREPWVTVICLHWPEDGCLTQTHTQHFHSSWVTMQGHTSLGWAWILCPKKTAPDCLHLDTHRCPGFWLPGAFLFLPVFLWFLSIRKFLVCLS